jgi:hypothetical protein
LPEKVKELKAEGKFNEAAHGAALMAQDQIEHLMQHCGYSIWEAREVALRQFILLPPETGLDEDDEQARELREMERDRRNRHQSGNGTILCWIMPCALTCQAESRRRDCPQL